MRVLNFGIGKKTLCRYLILRFGKNKKEKSNWISIFLLLINCYQICYRILNFVFISRDMWYMGTNIILLSNIRKKVSQTRQIFNFAILWFWNISRVQNFAKMVKNRNLMKSKFNTLKIQYLYSSTFNVQ